MRYPKSLPIWSVVSDGRTPPLADPIRSNTDAARVVESMIAKSDRESFVVIHMDIRNRPIAFERIATGDQSRCIVTPREVFKAAVMKGTSRIIVAHNHPSGVTDPSDDDRGTTKRLCEVGHLLGVPVIDHIIVADGSAPFSFAGCGFIVEGEYRG